MNMRFNHRSITHNHLTFAHRLQMLPVSIHINALTMNKKFRAVMVNQLLRILGGLVGKINFTLNLQRHLKFLAAQSAQAALKNSHQTAGARIHHAGLF